MYLITVKSDFSAAHNLKHYRGKCENLHGHNWKVEASFAYETLDANGLAVDFRRAKRALTAVLERLDHAYLNKAALLNGMNPTSENIARLIYEHLKKRNTHIAAVSVWESDDSCATYREA